MKQEAHSIIKHHNTHVVVIIQVALVYIEITFMVYRI